MQTFNIRCSFKRLEKCTAVVKLYRFINIGVSDFFIARFQVNFNSKLSSLVLTSSDMESYFGLAITSLICNDPHKVVGIFQTLLTNMEFIKTRLYKKLAMESVRESSEKKLFWIQNSLDFYNIDYEPIVKKKHKFLNEKAMYFKIIGKRVLKQHDSFIVLTIAEDLLGKTVYLFFYIPKSQRRFVVKFDKDFLITNLSEHVLELTQLMNSTKDYRMQRSIQNIEEVIVQMYRKQSWFREQDLRCWSEMLEGDNLLEKKNSVWLFKVGNLFGIVREYVSITMFESQQVLLETYIDGYLNQTDIFKPYAPMRVSDLRFFSFFISLTKSQRIIKKNDNINIYNFVKLTNFCSENRLDVNGRFFKDLVYLLEVKMLHKLSSTGISFHRINLNQFKHFTIARLQQRQDDLQMGTPDNIDSSKGFVFKRSLNARHTYTDQDDFNCQIIPIFSTVFTLVPRRIFSIYFNQKSCIISQNNHLFYLQHAGKAVFLQRVFF